MYIPGYLLVAAVIVRFLSQAPYLVEEDAVAPDVTGCGVPAVIYSLGGCPLHWNLATMRGVEVFVL